MSLLLLIFYLALTFFNFFSPVNAVKIVNRNRLLIQWLQYFQTQNKYADQNVYSKQFFFLMKVGNN